MIYYVCIALLGCAVGVIAMNTFKRFFKKEEEKEETKRVTRERAVFKADGHRYYVKDIEDGTVEFWVYLVEGDSHGEDEYFLGHWTTKEGFIPINGFRVNIPWQIQRSTERLRRFMLGKNYGLFEND